MFDVTILAVPLKVPFEFNVIPLGNDEPDFKDTVPALLSSINEIAVRLELALPSSFKVPREPVPVTKLGGELIAKTLCEVASLNSTVSFSLLYLIWPSILPLWAVVPTGSFNPSVPV